ncbi:MAG: hypothetical protein R3B84_13295 [Zavarzinella sp.]
MKNRWWLPITWAFLFLVLVSGCTRKFFRERSDREVEHLLNEKNVDPRWEIENWHAYPDSRARFFDPDNPDKPRKPYDDPFAEEMSPNSQPLRSHHTGESYGTGYLEYLRECDQLNRAMLAEMERDNPSGMNSEYQSDNPATRETLAQIDKALRRESNPFLINLGQASELALFNSREFQDRREDLYISALPVSLQRFSFVGQFFATNNAVRQWGNSRSVTPGGRWLNNADAGVDLLLPTGATLLASVANRLVIDLASNRTTVGLSNLTLEVTQPLLRGGGWAATMEPLTQAERNMVYAIRSYARFRKNYYVYLAAGDDLGNSPLGYQGLGGGLPSSGGAPAQGYLPTLLNVAQERNERANIINLSEFLLLYREYQGRGDYSELQVGQVEQQLLQGRSSLLLRRQNLQSGLDNFKQQLGLEVTTPIELDEEPIQPISELFRQYALARDEFGDARSAVEELPKRVKDPAGLLAGGLTYTQPFNQPVREEIKKVLTDSMLVRDTRKFRQIIPDRLNRWEKLTDEQLKNEIRLLSQELRDIQLKQARLQAANDELSDVELERLELLPKEITIGQFETALRAYDAYRSKPETTTKELTEYYNTIANAAIRVLGEARQERITIVRSQWPELPKVEIDGENLLTIDVEQAQAVTAQTALRERFDLMNARGQLVDSWRKIAVASNALLGVLDVGYRYGSPSTGDPDNPFLFAGSRGSHQLIINGELPLVRRLERNDYRTSLMAYQRQRRRLQFSEDQVLNNLRVTLRSPRLLQENYKIQQRAVELAYNQVENALDVLQAPPVPEGGPAQPGRAVAQVAAANAAALTQQLLTAQRSLLNAQNELYGTWVSYLSTRMQFYRDIERLPLDPRGVWLDDTPTRNSAATLGRPELNPDADGQPSGR